MNRDQHLEPEAQNDDFDVSPSIGDLMSGVLMFFALLFLLAQIQFQQELERAKRLEEQLQKYEQAFANLPQLIKKAIEQQIGDQGFTVDSKTGDVLIQNKLLFAEGSDNLSLTGKQFLQRFIPVYSQVVFANPTLQTQVTRIVVEGATDSNGADQSNMVLSQRRAAAVYQYIFSSSLDFPTKLQLRQKILVAGRGEIEANQKQIDPNDRRVVFRFQFRRPDLKQFQKEVPSTQNPSTP